jgi:hypothetical protein
MPFMVYSQDKKDIRTSLENNKMENKPAVEYIVKVKAYSLKRSMKLKTSFKTGSERKHKLSMSEMKKGTSLQILQILK